MVTQDPQAAMQMVTQMLAPWQAALEQPQQAQEQVLQQLLALYAQTTYGEKYGAETIGSIEDYRGKFPVATYDDYQPLNQRVMAGDTDLLLNEAPLGWAITRGTTRGENKFIPMTPTDIKMRVSAGTAVM